MSQNAKKRTRAVLMIKMCSLLTSHAPLLSSQKGVICINFYCVRYLTLGSSLVELSFYNNPSCSPSVGRSCPELLFAICLKVYILQRAALESFKLQF